MFQILMQNKMTIGTKAGNEQKKIQSLQIHFNIILLDIIHNH